MAGYSPGQIAEQVVVLSAAEGEGGGADENREGFRVDRAGGGEEGESRVCVGMLTEGERACGRQ